MEKATNVTPEMRDFEFILIKAPNLEKALNDAVQVLRKPGEKFASGSMKITGMYILPEMVQAQQKGSIVGANGAHPMQMMINLVILLQEDISGHILMEMDRAGMLEDLVQVLTKAGGEYLGKDGDMPH